MSDSKDEKSDCSGDKKPACSKSDYDIDIEHRRWRQFEIRPNRTEDNELLGYDFRTIQQEALSSDSVETMPFDYYARLKYVKYDSVLFQSVSDGWSGEEEALLQDEYDDEEVTIEDFPIYDQEIFEGQGWLTDDNTGEEVSDILTTCALEPLLLCMAECERDITDISPFLALVKDRVKKVDIYKMRFSHIEDEQRKSLQKAFEDWLLNIIDNNALESLRLDTVEFGNHATNWKDKLGSLIKNCEIPFIDVGFVGYRSYAFEMEFLKEHLKGAKEKMLKGKKCCEHAYRIDGEDLHVVEEGNMTESQEMFTNMCEDLGFEKTSAEEDADVLDYRLREDGWELSARLYSFILTVKCERL